MQCSWFLILLSVLFSFSWTTSVVASEATDKATEAFLIQSGVQDMINKTGHFVEQKALTYTEKLHIQKPIAVIGYGYRVFKSKQINFKLGKETITLQPDLISVSIPL